MVDVKWIKIVTDIFDDEKMLLIESLPSADSIIVIWFKLLCLAGKNNNSGVFIMNDKIPYTDEMLATIFRRDVNTVRLAIATFERYGMVEVINDVITIPNWDKHQNLDSIEKRRERQKMYMRERRKKQKMLANCEANSKANVSSLEEEREEEREEDKNKIDINIFIEKWNSLGIGKIISIKNQRLKHLKARIEEYSVDEVLNVIDKVKESRFLQGDNDRGWRVDFDWIVNPNNFTKVLEDKYKDIQVVKSLKKGSPDNFNNFQGRDYNERYQYLMEQILLGQATEEEKEEFEKMKGEE